eukprot:7116052-Ditylum_brightwellii.AAC.1
MFVPGENFLPVSVVKGIRSRIPVPQVGAFNSDGILFGVWIIQIVAPNNIFFLHGLIFLNTPPQLLPTTVVFAHVESALDNATVLGICFMQIIPHICKGDGGGVILLMKEKIL